MFVVDTESVAYMVHKVRLADMHSNYFTTDQSGGFIRVLSKAAAIWIITWFGLPLTPQQVMHLVLLLGVKHRRQVFISEATKSE